MERRLLSGDEAVAAAAADGGVHLGTGYPGTPSTEILEAFSALRGRAQWAPNEKVALEVGLGAAFAGARAIVTMKHVGLNVAADPLFTAAYTGVSGALVVVAADDPGMASSQNEQDSRRYAVAAGLPMLEPADSQEAYDLALAALELSQRWQLPVILRMTTRVCHSKSIVVRRSRSAPAQVPRFRRDVAARVMIPAYARPAHLRLRKKLESLQAWAETAPLAVWREGDGKLGIVANGVTARHAREAAPGASLLELKLVHPLPLEKIRAFAASVERCVVLEEGDPVIADAVRAAGIAVEAKAPAFRFGELDVPRVRRILARDLSPEPEAPKGKPPQLCEACPYHPVYSTLKKLGCIVAGDIGCYTLGVLPPYEGMDTCVAMGASLGVGLGLRHVLPEEDARKVVSIIGDSTFVHTGLNGLVEMVYNPPPTGHVLVVLDNGTTAMTGQQEHPGTGRTLDHAPTGKLSIEGLARALGVTNVDVVDPIADPAGFERLLADRLARRELSVVVARRPCILAAADIRKYEKAAAAAGCAACPEVENV
ncbi:thiamine pyrophosphate-dependent enzyme [Anaeromyxobacter terrae]|uniref:thiamine pyrophosphate-dependent enzyme n=1 Tax=Anaeromyxobacter terrae TaxID=2925406 RepID=UPI001F5A5F51|nr:thiamine pyrophosphate-dependent enzyme [Anaeromyxobacter sp. SG22]